MKQVLIVLILAGLAYGGTKLYLHHEVGKTVDAAMYMMSSVATVSYDGVSSTMGGQLTVDGIRATIHGYEDEIYIERLGIDTPNFLTLLELGDVAVGRGMSNGELPEYFGFIAEGVHIPAGADYYEEIHDLRLAQLAVHDADNAANECTGKYGFSPAALDGLGFSEQVIAASIIFRRQNERYSIEIESSIEGMWDLEMNLTLAGDMMTEVSKGTAYRPKMSKMRLVYTDRSLKERIQKYCQKLGLSPEETLQAQIDSFKFIGESGGMKFDEYMMDPYKEFLAGKSTLIVTADPHDPINLSQIDLYNPADVPALLNLAAIAQ